MLSIETFRDSREEPKEQVGKVQLLSYNCPLWDRVGKVMK